MIISIGMCVFLVVALLAQGSRGWISLRMEARVASNRPLDVSHLNRSVPDRLMPMVRSLAAVGLERLGETHTKVLPHRAPQATWILANADRTTIADMVIIKGKGLAVFSSTFVDGSVISTYSFGVSKSTPMLQVHVVTEGPVAAYAYHTQQVALAQRAGKTVRVIDGMETYLACDASFRERHLGAALGHIKRIATAQTGAGLYTLVVLGGTLLAYILNTPEETALASYLSTVNVLLAPAAIVSFGSALMVGAPVKET